MNENRLTSRISAFLDQQCPAVSDMDGLLTYAHLRAGYQCEGRSTGSALPGSDPCRPAGLNPEASESPAADSHGRRQHAHDGCRGMWGVVRLTCRVTYVV